MSESGCNEGSESDGYELVCPFWIDTAAYSDRDQFMFCCGYEFGEVLRNIRFNDDMIIMIIHCENESRVRMACGRFGRRCKIDALESGVDPDGNWSHLSIDAR